ncbi:MAG: hypothetical protein KDA88_10110 [Planctomycetaceae bacterium]|nr:hypothetical protein [Planctomycetaceae bacterium]MCB9952677.1 hypothetical protein [Planctomycetaceae bacterium]
MSNRQGDEEGDLHRDSGATLDRMSIVYWFLKIAGYIIVSLLLCGGVLNALSGVCSVGH